MHEYHYIRYHFVRRSDCTYISFYALDFCGLNLKTINELYVIPSLIGINNNLKGKQVFSRLDLVKGYFQVPFHKDSRAKIAVVTPFGLKNAGATFQ